MTEGGGANMAGQVPWDIDFIRALPKLARRYGTIWHIDEVVTGFRDAPGGWQSTVGVTPDLTALGKCMGGGLPVGAVVGRADIMDAFNPKNPPERYVRHPGTWNAIPLICAAGVAACKLYVSGEPQRKANELGAYLIEKGNKSLKKRGISGRLYGRTIVHLHLGSIDYEPSDAALPPTKDVQKIMNPATLPIRARLSLHLLQRGIATYGTRFFVLSAAHTKKDIDQTVEMFGSALDGMLAEGYLKVAK